MRPTWNYAAALSAVAKRHLAIANLQPFAAVVVAEAEVPTYGGRSGSAGGNGPTPLGNLGYTRSYEPPPSSPAYVYAGQTLLYMAGRTLRILPLHSGAMVRRETTVHVRRLLSEAVPASKDKRNFHFRPLHFADGIVSCVYVHRLPGTGHQESWLVLFNPVTRWCRSHRLALPHHRLFVRNNKDYLVFGTYTSRRLPEQDTDGAGLGGGEGQGLGHGSSQTTTPTHSGHRRWVLRHYSFVDDTWSTKAIFLDNAIGLADLGSSLCFEVLDGYFYALANQQRYLDEDDNEVDRYDGEEEEDDYDMGDSADASSESNNNSTSALPGRATGLFAPASYYTGVRFPLSDPQRREIPTRASLWRRRNNEGAVDDRWTTLRLEKSEVSGQILAVESRKEWLRVSGASSSRRTYYMQPLEWVNQNDGDSGRRRPTSPPSRLPEQVHPGDDAARMMPLTLSQCGARVYSTSSQTFMDLYYQHPPASADPLASPRLVLRAGTRRTRLNTDSNDNENEGSDSPLYPLRDINRRYVDRDVVTWPHERSEDDINSQAKALSDVLNPPGYCGTITATSWDDRVLIYATTSSDGNHHGARQAIVVVSFDPTLCLPGLEAWGEEGNEKEGEKKDGKNEEEGQGCSGGALPMPVLPCSSGRGLGDVGRDEDEKEEEEGGREGETSQASDFSSQATTAADEEGKERENLLLSSPPPSRMDVDGETEPSWVTFVEPMYRAISRGFDFSYHKRGCAGDYSGPL